MRINKYPFGRFIRGFDDQRRVEDFIQPYYFETESAREHFYSWQKIRFALAHAKIITQMFGFDFQSIYQSLVDRIDNSAGKFTKEEVARRKNKRDLNRKRHPHKYRWGGPED